jgi:Membrane-associating domain
LIRIL